jgi:hypothetical protein
MSVGTSAATVASDSLLCCSMITGIAIDDRHDLQRTEQTIDP